jgi:hypothetical protein
MGLIGSLLGLFMCIPSPPSELDWTLNISTSNALEKINAVEEFKKDKDIIYLMNNIEESRVFHRDQTKKLFDPVGLIIFFPCVLLYWNAKRNMS